MISEAVFIATISVILTAIAWIVVVLFKFKERLIKNEEKIQILEVRHNNLILEVATMHKDFTETLKEQKEDSSATRLILNELKVTLARLDTTFVHFNKTLDKLSDEFSVQKELVDKLRFSTK